MEKKVLTLGLAKINDRMDPAGTVTYSGWHVLTNIGSRLFMLDQNDLLAPELAKEWVKCPKENCYEVTIFEGLTFHDGNALTAYDVEFSLKRLARLDKKSDTYTLLDTKKTKAISKTKIKLYPKKPNDFFLYTFALPETTIVSSRHYYENKIGFKTKLPILSGPYEITALTDSELHMKPYEKHPYFSKHPKMPKEVLVYHTPKHPSIISKEQQENMKSGKINLIIDQMGNFGSALTEKEKEKFNEHRLEPQYSTVMTLNNIENSDLKSKKVRNALAALISDWDGSLVDKSISIKAHQIIPPGFLGYLSNPPVHSMNQHEDVYKDLRAKPINLKFFYAESEDPADVSRRKSFCSFAKDFGFNIEMTKLSIEELYDDIKKQKGQFHIAVAKVPFLQIDPTETFRADFNKDNVHFDDDRYDKLIEKSKIITTKQDKISLAEEIQNYLISKSLVIPIVFTSVTFWSTKEYNLKNINKHNVGLRIWEIEANEAGN